MTDNAGVGGGEGGARPAAGADAPQHRGEPHFRWRGGSVSRIEGLSDGVFALALTLLVVSLQVPRSFQEMLDAFRQVPVFLLTFAMFGWIWYLHHRFHRRFGLDDQATIAWNLVMLFVVLLYVYPLRYLATTLCQMFGIVDPPAPLLSGELASGLAGSELQGLMLLYGAGFTALFGVLAMLYRHAWSKRDDLGLDARERIITRGGLHEALACVGIGVLSMTFAAAGDGPWQFASGMTYSLTGLALSWTDRRRRRALAAVTASEAPAPAA